MMLSSDLLSQFAKITNDRSNESKETTVFGTVVNSDDGFKVRIDGSEVLTPVTMAVEAIPGERVAVMIKNHAATVTSNISSPLARLESVENVNDKVGEFQLVITNELNAVRVDTNSLIADNALIKNQLTVNTAEIETLSAEVAQIDTAKIESLESRVADIEQATIGDLDAKYARIDKANITTGWVTTAMIDVAAITTTQIADGSITDAKIVDLTANKITAGLLSVERLEIRGTENSIVYALNNITGALQAQNVDTLNGEILTERTITADKIVANAITANEIASRTITANEILANTITGDEIAANTITAYNIKSNTITADKINVDDLFAQDITAKGTIRGAKLVGASGVFTEKFEVNIGTNDEVETELEFTGIKWEEVSSYGQGEWGSITLDENGLEFIYQYEYYDGPVTPSIVRRSKLNINSQHIELVSESEDSINSFELGYYGVEITGDVTVNNGGITCADAVTSSGYVSAMYFYASGSGYPLTSASGVQLADNGNLYMPWAGDWLSNVFGRYLPLTGGSINGAVTVGGALTCTNYIVSQGAVYANNWFRSYGGTGWYNETYGGGVFQTDTLAVRIYQKSLWIDHLTRLGQLELYYNGFNAIFRNDGTYFYILPGTADGWTATTWYMDTKGRTFMTNGFIARTNTYMMSLSRDQFLRCYDGSLNSVDGVMRVGSPNYRMGQIYSTNAAISTSDRNQKKDIQSLEDKHFDFLMKLLPVSFKFKEGTSGRTHIGFIAQDVEEAMIECGLADMDFAGFCKDKKRVCHEDSNGGEYYEDILDEDGNQIYIYSLRYEEFIALIALGVQRCYKEIQTLKGGC